jgi:hypothetical protein
MEITRLWLLRFLDGKRSPLSLHIPGSRYWLGFSFTKVRTLNCPLFESVEIEHAKETMSPAAPQKDLFALPTPTPDTIFVNDRVCVETEQGQRVLFVHGIVFSHYSIKYLLHEQPVRFLKGKLRLRQVTRLTETGHQTPIVTSRWELRAIVVAHRMFERWRQENFFKYLRVEYLIDALADYQVEPDDPTRSVPNPAQKAVVKEIHAARVHLRKLRERYGATAIDYINGPKSTDSGFEIAEEKIRMEIAKATNRIKKLKARRDSLPARVTVANAQKDQEMMKLSTERKHLTNVSKMVAYQTESDLVELIRPHYSRVEDGLWRVPLRYGQDLAVETTHHLQSRGGTCRQQGSEGQPALRGHQPKTESALDLRAGLLSAGRRREQDKGTARRHADRPHQLLELFGEHVSGAADRGGLRADAGDASPLGPHCPRSRASLDLARAFSKTRSPSHRHGASHRADTWARKAAKPTLLQPKLTLCHALTRGVSLRFKT